MQPNLFDLLGEDNPFKEQKANDYYWTLKDLANVSKNNKKVFSCFSGKCIAQCYHKSQNQ